MSISCQKNYSLTIATPILLASSPNPSFVGQSVAIIASVSTSGTVSFFSDASLIGTAALSAGVATLNYSGLTVGTHTLTATLGALNSNPVSQVVNPLSPCPAHGTAITCHTFTTALNAYGVYPANALTGNLVSGSTFIDDSFAASVTGFRSVYALVVQLGDVIIPGPIRYMAYMDVLPGPNGFRIWAKDSDSYGVLCPVGTYTMIGYFDSSTFFPSTTFAGAPSTFTMLGVP